MKLSADKACKRPRHCLRPIQAGVQALPVVRRLENAIAHKSVRVAGRLKSPSADGAILLPGAGPLWSGFALADACRDEQFA